MDEVAAIKARLPIEELVGQYCTLKKKGRNFVCVCPFHNDTHPSFLVSPDKGIAYCFVCQSGGDIFSFYQAVEGVDFRQAIKDLADRTGVTLEQRSGGSTSVQKDEKDQLRSCLQDVLSFYREQAKTHTPAQEYIRKRGLSKESVDSFDIGFAPDSFSETYQHLLKKGHSKKEIIDTSLAIQKDLQEGKMYDRFRNRIMFPIHDHNGHLVAFGGRTIGDDDAKYINSSEGPLYNKSRVLYGLHKAKEKMRETKQVILVEGYLDVIACHAIGITNVVAVSGTALTEEHVLLLKRYVETVVLCLDQDQAGKDAASRSFELCAPQGLAVNAVSLPTKDPDEMAASEPDRLRDILSSGGIPYIEHVLQQLVAGDIDSAAGKRDALRTLLPLLSAVTSSVVRSHFLTRAAAVLGTTESALQEDLQTSVVEPSRKPQTETIEVEKKDAFSRIEVALGMIMLHPSSKDQTNNLIEPDDGASKALYHALIEHKDGDVLTPETLDVSEADRERIAILYLYCEHHGFLEWSDSLARREIEKTIAQANREHVRVKQKEISKKILEANREGRIEDAAKLMEQYSQVLQLAKVAG